MATFKGKEGIWRTSETGVHYFIPDGVSPEDAWNEWSKERHYLQYWKVNETDKWGMQSLSGINKKEYNELVESGAEVEIRDYLNEKNWYKSVPEDIEERMANALNSITKIENKEDFFNQLKKTVWGNGVNIDNWQVIRDAFDNEIKEKYNKLIQPAMDRINSIDIDNSDKYFDEGLSKYSSKLSPEKTQQIKSLYDNCENEDCKIMMAVVANEFKTSYEITNRGDSEYGDNHISIGSLKTSHLAHENFHSVFEHYNIEKTDLPKILKEEFNKKVIQKIEEDFGSKTYIKEHYDEEQAKHLIEMLDRENELRIEKDKAYRIFKNAESLSHDEYVLAKDAYLRAERNWKHSKFYADAINSDVRSAFRKKYDCLADMIEATGIKIASGTNLGSGHGATYWKNRGEYIQADEFFAEMAEIKATNSPEYEVIKKYIPKAVAKFEEIFKDIINNKGKVYEL